MPLHLHLSTIDVFILLHIYIDNEFQNKSGSIFLEKVKVDKVTAVVLDCGNQQKWHQRDTMEGSKGILKNFYSSMLSVELSDND